MKITDIEVIPVAMPLAARYADAAGRVRMGGIDDHVVVKIHTDNGLTGYGDYEDVPRIDESVIQSLIGRNPFDYINNDLNLALGMALYDVMGKYLEVPAYKLMGQKLRDAVPCAAWTRPCSPEVFAAEVRRSAEQGYRVFKMHSNARYDVIEQTRAAADAVPAGFKLHWDFNHNRSPGVVLPILAEMERDHSHIVGFVEDPLPWQDVDGWARLRAKSKIPLIMHVPQLGGIQEVMAGAADIYMTGGAIGRTLRAGFAYGQANVQTLIQQSGGALMKALTLHQAAVLPTATAHVITLDDQYERDIAAPVAVDEGFSRVPEAPGLGLEVDDGAIAEFARGERLGRVEYIGVLTLPGGKRMYTKGSPGVQQLTGFEEGALPGIGFEYWEDDGSEEYRKARARLDAEGTYMA